MSNNVGAMLRTWRNRRRFSQLELAGEVEMSTRHLSFVESGRSAPSREMLLRLAEPLGMPLRERNRLLLAGGFAPIHREEKLDAPAMSAAQAAIGSVLSGHMPFPALAVDRHWNLLSANEAVTSLMEGVDPALLEPPVNVLRLSLHPDGLSKRIENLAEWRHHLLSRLGSEIDKSGDETLAALAVELAAMPYRAARTRPSPVNPVAVPLLLKDTRSDRTLSLISTTTVFGTATDVTLSELTLECFFPADAQTRDALLLLSERHQ